MCVTAHPLWDPNWISHTLTFSIDLIILVLFKKLGLKCRVVFGRCINSFQDFINRIHQGYVSIKFYWPDSSFRSLKFTNFIPIVRFLIWLGTQSTLLIHSHKALFAVVPEPVGLLSGVKGFQFLALILLVNRGCPVVSEPRCRGRIRPLTRWCIWSIWRGCLVQQDFTDVCRRDSF